MKLLTLIRHTQAAQGYPDINRALTVDGVCQAQWLGAMLKSKEFCFDALFSSGAQRTIETAEHICEELGLPVDIIKTEATLYNVDMETLYRYIGQIDAQIDHAVIIGHNPAIHWLVQDLTCTDLDGVPPGSLLHIALDIEFWFEVGAGSGDLLERCFPPKL